MKELPNYLEKAWRTKDRPPFNTEVILLIETEEPAPLYQTYFGYYLGFNQLNQEWAISENQSTVHLEHGYKVLGWWPIPTIPLNTVIDCNSSNALVIK